MAGTRISINAGSTTPGCSLEDSYGHGWNTPFHPDDRQRAWDAWQQAIAGGHYNVECRLRGADGGYRWMLVRGLPLRDATGQTVKWIGTCTDIDDLKQAQESALRSEGVQRALAAELETERARLIAAQAVASIGSWETDLATLTVIWSAETHRIFETTPEQFPPTHAGFLQLIHPDDRARVDEAFARSLDHCSSGVIEHRLLMPDGRIKFVEERWQVVCNEQGQPGRAIGTCQDITDRRRAQESIRQKDALIRIAGRLTHTGGWAIETPGDRVFWSDELFEILEFARGSMPSLAEALALYPNPSREKIVAAIHACQEDGTPFDLEIEVLTAKGTRKWARVSAEAERNADGSITRVRARSRTSPSGSTWSNSICARSAWRASARWPAASPTISTTCSPRSCCRSACSRRTRTIRSGSRHWPRSRRARNAAPRWSAACCRSRGARTGGGRTCRWRAAGARRRHDRPRHLSEEHRVRRRASAPICGRCRQTPPSCIRCC